MGEQQAGGDDPSRSEGIFRRARARADEAAPWLIDPTELEELARLMPDLSTALIAQIMGVEVAPAAAGGERCTPSRG
ncbi:hypothetical protein ACIQUM_36420 [Amycolatopsis azurea]|uniref:hypothetical protein n=1 Tax=Amycolatopsis azurea TaxID=36819 RepID=UPI003807659B